MNTHRKLVLAIATTLGIGLTVSGGVFGHGWGQGYGYGSPGFQPWATPVQVDQQPAGEQCQPLSLEDRMALGQRGGYGRHRAQQAGVPHYGRRLHAGAHVCPRMLQQGGRPHYGAWLGRPGKGPVPPPAPGECPNAKVRQADEAAS